METTGTPDFKYFAFISYSRKDSRAAAFLHKKLEKFRIPIKRVPEEMRKGLRKFVRPVFRDKRDLEVGESSFTEDVKKALEGSRFIIVLCSSNSAQSVWVDNEIKYFLSTHGNDLSKVVPVVLSGNPDSGDGETECLCECLLSETIKPVIVKRNLPTMIPDEGEPEKVGWEAGVVGVLSYMLKVKRHDIKATIDAEKMRQMRIYAAIGVACSAVFASLSFWAVTAERLATQNRILAEANEKRAIENEQLAKNNEMRAAEQERIALEQRDKAIISERRIREKNEQLEYIRFVHESLSSIRSYKVDSSPRLNSLFDPTNKMQSVIGAPNTAHEYVKNFVNGNYMLVGPRIIGLMLEKMQNDLQAQVNMKCDEQMLLNMQDIFWGNQLCCIEQEIRTNATLTVARKEALDQLRQTIQKMRRTLELKRKQIDVQLKILSARRGMAQESDEAFDKRIEALIKKRDYVAAIDAVKASSRSDIKVSNALWKIISNMPVDEGMDEMKVFYSLLERNNQRMKALEDKRYSLFIAHWDLRIAELFAATRNYQEVVKYIEDAVAIFAKQDIFQGDFRSEIPLLGEVYTDIDSSLLAQFFESSETNKYVVAKNISCLYDVLLIQRILSCSIVSPGKPYLSWYVYGRREELLSTYEFHGRLYDFVAKKQGIDKLDTIRNALRILKNELARCHSVIEGRRHD